jgi:hypothetical protein
MATQGGNSAAAGASQPASPADSGLGSSPSETSSSVSVDTHSAIHLNGELKIL